MNPYDFVPIDLNTPPERHAPVLHEKFQGVCGNLTGRITAETPIFVKRGRSEEFIANGQGVYIIPGTALKGLFRSLVETVANGCFGGKFDGRYRDRQRGTVDHTRKLPYTFKECSDPNNLCIACRTFGMLKGQKLFTGKVSFQDAVCTNPIPHSVMNTVDLMGPKPHHTAFYVDGNKIAGRKFYFHHQQVTTKEEHGRYNQRIKPLDQGSQFRFTASFSNLEPEEWQVLLYAIMLESDMRHKIGYAKPSGLGSVKIELESIQLIDYTARYSSPNRGITNYQGDALKKYIAGQIQRFTNNNASQTLSELRRIWHWDSSDTTRYQYPTADDRNWFKKNPKIPISQTP